MVAFTTTSLYLSYYKNNISQDFIGALNQVAAAGGVDQSSTGLPDAQVAVLGSSVNTVAADLNTGLGHALGTARIKLTVTDSADGSAIDAADVILVDPDGIGTVPLTGGCVVDGVGGSDCADATDTSGQVVFCLNPAPVASTDYTVLVSKSGYITKQMTTQTIALATVGLSVGLEPEPSAPTTLSNAGYSLVILNECTKSDGGLPYSTFNLSFDYSDANGDANQAAGATLAVDYEFVGGNKFQVDQTASLAGADGFSGSIEFDQCIRFDDRSQLNVTFTLTDGDGNASDGLLLSITRPLGAN